MDDTTCPTCGRQIPVARRLAYDPNLAYWFMVAWLAYLGYFIWACQHP
jgi:hypothetical protein